MSSSTGLPAAPRRRWSGRARRAICWIRDLWSAVGLALLLLLLLNWGASWLFEGFREKVGRSFVSRPAFLASAQSTESSLLQELAHDIAATHDSPFEACASRWEPYVYWRSKPYAGRCVVIEENGLRRTVQDAPPAGARTLEVFCFGGSTMWGSGVRDEETIPSLLADKLQKIGLAVVVTNYGQPGYVSTQEVLALLLELQQERIPDLVIFYDGFNDSGAALLNSTVGLAADEFQRRAEHETFRQPTFSAMVRLYARHLPLTKLLLPSFQADLVTRSEQRKAGQPLDQIAMAVARRYLRNIQSAQALANGFGFETSYFWQPLVATRQTPAMEERVFLTEGMTGFHTAMADIVGQIRNQLAASDPAVGRLTLLDDLFDQPEHRGRSYFFDDCHLGATGNRIVAQRIADSVEPILRKRLENIAAMQQSLSSRSSLTAHSSKPTSVAIPVTK